MIFSVISAILVICQIMSGGRRIEQMNQEYGQAVKVEGLIFFMSNIIAAFFFYFLGSGKYSFGNHGVIFGTISQLILFGGTELLPLLSYIEVVNKFVGVVHPVARNGRPVVEPNPEEAA